MLSAFTWSSNWVVKIFRNRSQASPAALCLLAALAAGTMLGQRQLPEAAGKATMLKVCRGCHDPLSVIGQAHTPEKWGEIVGQMADLGAHGTNDEFNKVTDHLAKFLPPSATTKKINVNKASAKEIESALKPR
jgi:hypothetical protein